MIRTLPIPPFARILPILPGVPILAFVLFMPGCIAWEIRDEMRSVNQNLVVVQSQLTGVHERMVKIDEELASTNPTLTNLDAGLERMKILTQIETSMEDLNKALVPLSGTVGKLGSAMSFLGMSSDTSRDLLAEEPAEGTGPTEVAEAKPDAKPEAKPDAKPGAAPKAETKPEGKRPDPILGTWMRVYPPVTGAAGQAEQRLIVLMADGKFLLAEGGKPPQMGTWSRQVRALTMTLDAAPPTPTPPPPATPPQPATPGAKGGAPAAPAAPPTPEVMELLTLNARTLTLRRGDQVVVYSRP